MRRNRRTSKWVRLLEHMLRFAPIYRLANLVTAVRFVVKGDSMEPSFSREQYILVSRMAYLWQGPRRGDVVVLRHPEHLSRNYIKRIVGLPGETVQVPGERIYINGGLLHEPYLNGDAGNTASDESPAKKDNSVGEWSLGDDQYFVMGDNRSNSDDSRSLGPLGRELIIGKAWACYWPRSAWGIIRS